MTKRDVLGIVGFATLLAWLPAAPLFGEPGDALPVLWLTFAPFIACGLFIWSDAAT